MVLMANFYATWRNKNRAKSQSSLGERTGFHIKGLNRNLNAEDRDDTTGVACREKMFQQDRRRVYADVKETTETKVRLHHKTINSTFYRERGWESNFIN